MPNGNGRKRTQEVLLWGVYYDVESTTELNLSDSGLTGEIPEEICQLTFLEYVELNDNNLIGSIPECVGNQLINLKELYLDNNNLSTPIPSSICNILELYNTVSDQIGNGLMGEGDLTLDENSWCYDDLPWCFTGLTEPTRPPCNSGYSHDECGQCCSNGNVDNDCCSPSMGQYDGCWECPGNEGVSVCDGDLEACGEPPYFLEGWMMSLAEDATDNCAGCMDETAPNYNPDAVQDAQHPDEECARLGCTDDTACNYNQNANIDDGSCSYAPGVTTCYADLDEDLDFETPTDVYLNCYETCGTYGYSSTLSESSGCTDDTACNYNESADIDDGTCYYAEDAFQCPDGSMVCEEDECRPPILGCTDPEATNYNSEANQDDSSCQYLINPVDENGIIITFFDESNDEFTHPLWDNTNPKLYVQYPSPEYPSEIDIDSFTSSDFSIRSDISNYVSGERAPVVEDVQFLTTSNGYHIFELFLYIPNAIQDNEITIQHNLKLINLSTGLTSIQTIERNFQIIDKYVELVKFWGFNINTLETTLEVSKGPRPSDEITINPSQQVIPNTTIEFTGELAYTTSFCPQTNEYFIGSMQRETCSTTCFIEEIPGQPDSIDCIEYNIFDELPWSSTGFPFFDYCNQFESETCSENIGCKYSLSSSDESESERYCKPIIPDSINNLTELEIIKIDNDKIHGNIDNRLFTPNKKVINFENNVLGCYTYDIDNNYCDLLCKDMFTSPTTGVSNSYWCNPRNQYAAYGHLTLPMGDAEADYGSYPDEIYMTPPNAEALVSLRDLNISNNYVTTEVPASFFQDDKRFPSWIYKIEYFNRFEELGITQNNRLVYGDLNNIDACYGTISPTQCPPAGINLSNNEMIGGGWQGDTSTEENTICNFQPYIVPRFTNINLGDYTVLDLSGNRLCPEFYTNTFDELINNCFDDLFSVLNHYGIDHSYQDTSECDIYLYGCADSNASNYDSEVDENNGSCVYDAQEFDTNFISYGDDESSELPTINDGVTTDIIINFSANGLLQPQNNAAHNDIANSFNLDSGGFTAQIIDSGGWIDSGGAEINVNNFSFDYNDNIDKYQWVVNVTVPDAIQDTSFNLHHTFEILGTFLGSSLLQEHTYQISVSDITPTEGCTDPEATNTTPYATVDDLSCEYEGCTSPLAQNYFCTFVPDSFPCNLSNQDYTIDDVVDDGSCIIQGCTDANALNYNSEATNDDGSCIYPEPLISGCMDETAYNYNDEANFDDGTVCIYYHGSTPINLNTTDDVLPVLFRIDLFTLLPSLREQLFIDPLNPWSGFNTDAEVEVCIEETSFSQPVASLDIGCYQMILPDFVEGPFRDYLSHVGDLYTGTGEATTDNDASYISYYYKITLSDGTEIGDGINRNHITADTSEEEGGNIIPIDYFYNYREEILVESYLPIFDIIRPDSGNDYINIRYDGVGIINNTEALIDEVVIIEEDQLSIIENFEFDNKREYQFPIMSGDFSLINDFSNSTEWILDPLIDDLSFMRDELVYDLFKEMGYITPFGNQVHVYDEIYRGLYFLKQVDLSLNFLIDGTYCDCQPDGTNCHPPGGIDNDTIYHGDWDCENEDGEPCNDATITITDPSTGDMDGESKTVTGFRSSGGSGTMRVKFARSEENTFYGNPFKRGDVVYLNVPNDFTGDEQPADSTSMTGTYYACDMGDWDTGGTTQGINLCCHPDSPTESACFTQTGDDFIDLGDGTTVAYCDINPASLNAPLSIDAFLLSELAGKSLDFTSEIIYDFFLFEYAFKNNLESFPNSTNLQFDIFNVGGDIISRWNELREYIFNISKIEERIDNKKELFENDFIYNYKKNSSTDTTYDEEVSSLKSWIRDRVIYIDQNIRGYIEDNDFSLDVNYCNDVLATNYNSEANFNDGTCEYLFQPIYNFSIDIESVNYPPIIDMKLKISTDDGDTIYDMERVGNSYVVDVIKNFESDFSYNYIKYIDDISGLFTGSFEEDQPRYVDLYDGGDFIKRKLSFTDFFNNFDLDFKESELPIVVIDTTRNDCQTNEQYYNGDPGFIPDTPATSEEDGMCGFGWYYCTAPYAELELNYFGEIIYNASYEDEADDVIGECWSFNNEDDENPNVYPCEDSDEIWLNPEHPHFHKHRYYLEKSECDLNCPIECINGEIYQDEPKITAHMKIFYKGEEVTNNIEIDEPQSEHKIGIEIRGFSHRGFAKKQFGIELQDGNVPRPQIDDRELSYSLFCNDFKPEAEINYEDCFFQQEEDFVILGAYRDKTLMKNALSYELWRQLGKNNLDFIGSGTDRPSIKTKFVELVVNGSYKGVYVFMEKVKLALTRINIDNTVTDAHTIVKIESGAEHGAQSLFIGSDNRTKYEYFEPDYTDIEELTEEMKTKIQSTVYALENQLSTPRPHTDELFDLYGFIDYAIVQDLALNREGFSRSQYWYFDTDSLQPKVYMGPVWDFNHAYGGFDTIYDKNTILEYSFGQPQFWLDFWGVYNTQIGNAEGIGYVEEIAERYESLRTNILSIRNIMGYIDKTYTLFSNNKASERDFLRWYRFGRTFDEEIIYFKNWILNRIRNRDNTFIQMGTATHEAIRETRFYETIYPINNQTFDVNQTTEIPIVYQSNIDGLLEIRDRLTQEVIDSFSVNSGNVFDKSYTFDLKNKFKSDLIKEYELSFVSTGGLITYQANNIYFSIVDVAKQEGCTDVSALNFDIYATFDDGSCIYRDDIFGEAQTTTSTIVYSGFNTLTYPLEFVRLEFNFFDILNQGYEYEGCDEKPCFNELDTIVILNGQKEDESDEHITAVFIDGEWKISGDYGLSIDDNIKSGDGFLLHVQEEGVINL